MRLPLWIAGPAVIALSAVDAAIEVQNRAVGALTRAAIRRMDPPARQSDSTGVDSSAGPMDFVEEVLAECGAHGPRIDAGDPPLCRLQSGHAGRHRPNPDDGWGQDLCWGGI
ncbi:hypothetical protein GCM10027068_13700 [Prescottella soli]